MNFAMNLIDWTVLQSSIVQYLLPLLGLYLAALLIHICAPSLARHILNINRFRAETKRWRIERLDTLQGLISNLITFLAFFSAILFTLSLFVSATTIVWFVGLFSAAFGLGAHPIIGNYLAGIGFIFQDTIADGEKVELLGLGCEVEGVVESVHLSHILMRGMNGELYTVPNGIIRVIRNFSRGRFSRVKAKVRIAGDKLDPAIVLLEELGEEALTLLPNLLDVWDVLSSNGEIGRYTELTITAKAKYGQSAKMQPRLLALVHKRLREAGIELIE